MLTVYRNVNADDMRADDAPATANAAIAEAARIVRAGGLVAFPTETVYGLGANATDAEAVARIYAAKQRALNDPLIVHIAPGARPPALSLDALAPGAATLDALSAQQIIGALDERQHAQAAALIEHFWPGPLTLVLPRGARIPTNATAGLDTVAVRMPAHTVALALIRASGVPIAAPSANRFGHVSPTTAQHVRDDLDGRIDMVLDGGPTRIGVESTVLDLCTPERAPIILRPGGLAREAIEHVLNEGVLRRGAERVRGSEGESMASPGMLSKHYAPHARLAVAADTDEMLRLHATFCAQGLRVGTLIRDEQRSACAGLHPQFELGDSLAEIARRLYAGLRALDADGVNVILVSAMPRDGLGEAIADRLRRAAARGD